MLIFKHIKKKRFKFNVIVLLYIVTKKQIKVDNKKIYRVFNSKKKYRQSYCCSLSESYAWAIDCALTEKGYGYEDTICNSGNTIESKLVYPKNKK